VFRVLKETLRGNPVATAGSVASKLEIFLKELLCRAADTNLRPVAVEYMVSIEWGSTARVVTHTTAAVSSATTA